MDQYFSLCFSLSLGFMLFLSKSFSCTIIFNIAKKLGLKIEEKLDADGITLTQNNGLYEEVKHFHLHIVPQYKEKRELLDLNEVYKIINN